MTACRVHHPLFQDIEIKAFIVLTALVTLKMTYKISPSYIRNRDGIYHFIRRIPVDLQGHYRSDRVCLSLRTKSEPKALQVAGSISQRLDDYWSGLRLQKMDVPAIHLLISDNDDARHDSPTLKEAVEAYLILKGGGRFFTEDRQRTHTKKSEKLSNAREKILLKRAFLRSVMMSTPSGSMMPDRQDMTRTVKIMSGAKLPDGQDTLLRSVLVSEAR